MRPEAWAWIALGATIVVIEAVLFRNETSMSAGYQLARELEHKSLKYAPLVVTLLLVAHLEGWIPRHCDPVVWLGAALRRLVT